MKIIKVNIDQMGLEIWAHQTAIHMLSLNIDQSRDRQIDCKHWTERQKDTKIRYIYRHSDRQKKKQKNRCR